MQQKGEGVELIINTNIAAFNAYNNLMKNHNSMIKSFRELSLGKRINSATNDSAGLAISEKMKA